MRKRFFVTAFVLAASGAVIMSGCAGCSGCGANNNKNAAAFSSNWYADTSFRYVQPTFTGEENAEVITYNVKFDGSAAENKSYKVAYGEGTYTTTFYATTFDKSKVAEEYKGGYPEKEMTVYYYKTELEIPSVTFTLRSGEVKEFSENAQHIVTECYFLDVNNHLRPIYSEQDITCVSPAKLHPKKIDDAYEQFSYLYTTSYSYDGKNAKTTVINRLDGNKESEKKASKLNKGNNSLIDFAGLNVAVRAMQLSGNFEQALSVYSPAAEKKDYLFFSTSLTLSDDDRAAVTPKLIENKLFKEEKDDKDNVKPLETVCVATSLNAKMNGVSQAYWFTKINNTINNTGRATMVKMTQPLSYGLGMFNYVLSDIQSTLWNGVNSETV